MLTKNQFNKVNNMNVSGSSTPTISDTDTLIDIDLSERELTTIEQTSFAVDNFAKKNILIQFVKYSGTFTTGYLVGNYGTLVIDEISAKVFKVVIPNMIREISLYSGVAAFGAFAIVAFPIIFYTSRP